MPTHFAQCEASRNEKLRDAGLTSFSAIRHVRRMAGTSFTLHVHLRAWRRYRGLTLEQTANKIGSKSNTLSGWETGNRKVDLDDLAKLAAVYGVDPAALLYAPEGSPELEAIRETNGIVKKMKPAKLRTWLDTGHAMSEGD